MNATKAQAESLKWLGLAAMLVDHAARYLGATWPLWHIVGRAAMPAFALALGRQLDQHKAKATAARLLTFGVLILPLYEWATRGTARPDILLSLACAAWAIHAKRYTGSTRAIHTGLAVMLSCAADYGPVGLLLALAANGPATWRNHALAALGATALYYFGGGIEGAAWATAWYTTARLLPEAPRVKRFFLRTYLAQWPLIIALRAVGA